MLLRTVGLKLTEQWANLVRYANMICCVCLFKIMTQSDSINGKLGAPPHLIVVTPLLRLYPWFLSVQWNEAQILFAFSWKKKKRKLLQKGKKTTCHNWYGYDHVEQAH
jgi:hypothetical protein